MNELLISEVNSDEKDLLEKMLLIEAYIFADESIELDNLNTIISACQHAISDIEGGLLQAEELINHLYLEQLLLDTERDFWAVSAHKMQLGLDYRILAPSLKAIIVKYIIAACGFDVDILFVPEKIMIRIVCDELYAIIFDPITGESLNWQELDSRMEEFELSEEHQALEISDNSLIIKHLTSLKNELIKEQCFDHALKSVDILLALRPDDPFERRDRGFLLQQLDCFKVAVDDYRYFVQQCPTDPAAQLLKLQLDTITLADTVLH